MPDAKPTTASKSLDLATEIERLNGVVAALEKRLERLEAATPGVPSLGYLNDFERAQKESQKEAERAEPRRGRLNCAMTRKPAPPDTPEQGEIERRKAQTRRFVKQRERNLRILDAALVAIRQAAREDSSAHGWAEEEVATGVLFPPHITPPLSPNDIPREVTEVSESAPRGARGWPEGDAATGVPLSPHITPPLSPDDIPREVTEVSEAAPRALPPSAPIPVDDTADIKLIALRWSGGK